MSAGGAAPSAWTWRDWAPAWFQSAWAVGTLAVRAPSPLPVLACLALLAAVPPRRGPWRLPRWIPYALALVHVLAFAVVVQGLRDGRGGWSGLFEVPAWYFASLSCLQAGAVGRSTRAANASWSALACQILSGPWSGPAAAAGIVQFVLAWALPGDRFHRRPGGNPLRIGVALLLPVLLLAALGGRAGALAEVLDPRPRWSGQGPVLKGFSPVAILGSFADERGERDDEVAVRSWGPHAPFLQGAAFDLYGAGAWRKAGPPRLLESPRMVGEAQAFCRDGRDPGPRPDGWTEPVLPTASHLLVPSGTACAAVFADSVASWPGGTSVARGEDPGRGIGWWSPPDSSRAEIPSDRTVPRGLEGLLDTVLLRAQVPRGAAPEVAERALGRWFAGAFAYSLVPGRSPGEDPLRRFARERRGYCEHFASLGVLALRRAGIPARYCTGYAWPDRGPGGAWIYRRRSAHAWVLVLHPDRGWIPWDPTPASDRFPDRPSRFGRAWQDLATRFSALRHQVRDGNWHEGLDRIAEAWDAWTGRAAAAAVLGVAALLLAARIRRRRKAAGWEATLDRAESRLAREGLLRRPGETVGAFLGRLPSTAPRGAVLDLTDYQARRFAPGGETTACASPPPVPGPPGEGRP